MDDPLPVGGSQSVGQRHSELEEPLDREPSLGYQPV